MRAPFGRCLPFWLAIEGQVKVRDRIIDPGKIVEIPERLLSFGRFSVWPRKVSAPPTSFRA